MTLQTPRERLPQLLARLQRLGYPWRRFGFVEGDAVIELRAQSAPSPRYWGEFAFLTAVPESVQWIERASSFPLAGQKELPAKLAPCTAVIRIPLRLGQAPPASWDESFWVLDGGPERFVSLLANLDERVLRRFEFARIRHANRERLILRAAPHGPNPVLPLPFQGFVEHKSRQGIIVPAGTTFVPAARPDRLGEALELDPHSIIWVESGATGFNRHRLPVSAFRPLDDFISYTTPMVTPAVNVRAPGSAFPLLPFTQQPDPVSAPPTLTERPAVVAKPTPTGWLGRILTAGRKASKHLTRLAPVASINSSKIPSPISRPAISRAGQKLIDRLLNRTPTTPPGEIAQSWVELAHVLMRSSHPADAAVCWLNAIWEHPTPPEVWLVGWLRAEERMTSGTDGTPRLATSVLTNLGFAPEGPTHVEQIRQLLGLIEVQEADLPVRAVWLAHLATARLTGGDQLGLARCRDRLLGRLTTAGLALDIDAPSFLRSHTGADTDGVRSTHRWLTAVREPIHRWIRKQATGGGLEWAGLDTNVGSTTAYADLILACGLSRLGDRGAVDRLVNEAKEGLHQVKGKRGEKIVHQTLLVRFLDHIRAAQSGILESHDKSQSLEPETALTPLGRYAVDVLSSKLSILSTVNTPHPRRGIDLHPLFGSDPLGSRLADLVRTQDATTVSEFLTVVALDPTARTLPRVTLALAELCGRLDTGTATGVVKLLPRAIELLPEAVRLNGITGGGTHTLLIRFVARAIEAGCSLAKRYHLPSEFEAVVSCLIDHLSQGDSVVRAAVTLQLSQLVAALRKLGLTPAIKQLVVGAGQDGTALGCYLRGQPESAIGHLNVIRDELFGTARATERARTRQAFAYVAALAQAPPDLARERLIELFDRLDRIHSAGATARFFAIRPLELVDAAVSAVVSDRFDLSPFVRRWLDEDEFLVRKRIAGDLAAALNGS